MADEELRALRETVDQMRLEAANTRASARLQGLESQVEGLRGDLRSQGGKLDVFCERTEARHEAITGQLDDIKVEAEALRTAVLEALRRALESQHDLAIGELDGETQVRIAHEQAVAARWQAVGAVVAPVVQDRRVLLGFGALVLIAIIASASPEYLGLVLDRLIGTADGAAMVEPAAQDVREDAATDADAPEPPEQPDALTVP